MANIEEGRVMDFMVCGLCLFSVWTLDHRIGVDFSREAECGNGEIEEVGKTTFYLSVIY